MMWVVSANTQFATVTEKTISEVHVSPGSAETLVRRDGITNHHSIAYALSNISAKNYQNWLMCVEVMVCNISVVFRHNVYLQFIPSVHSFAEFRLSILTFDKITQFQA